MCLNQDKTTEQKVTSVEADMIVFRCRSTMSAACGFLWGILFKAALHVCVYLITDELWFSLILSVQQHHITVSPCGSSVHCRRMNWNTPSSGWWMDWLTRERLPDLASVWHWDRWVQEATSQRRAHTTAPLRCETSESEANKPHLLVFLSNLGGASDIPEWSGVEKQ